VFKTECYCLGNTKENHNFLPQTEHLNKTSFAQIQKNVNRKKNVLDCVKSDSRTEIFCLSENASHALLAKDLSIPLQKERLVKKLFFLKIIFCSSFCRLSGMPTFASDLTWPENVKTSDTFKYISQVELGESVSTFQSKIKNYCFIPLHVLKSRCHLRITKKCYCF